MYTMEPSDSELVLSMSELYRRFTEEVGQGDMPGALIHIDRMCSHLDRGNLSHRLLHCQRARGCPQAIIQTKPTRDRIPYKADHAAPIPVHLGY